jgi:hypothetical protein
MHGTGPRFEEADGARGDGEPLYGPVRAQQDGRSVAAVGVAEPATRFLVMPEGQCREAVAGRRIPEPMIDSLEQCRRFTGRPAERPEGAGFLLGVVRPDAGVGERYHSEPERGEDA